MIAEVRSSALKSEVTVVALSGRLDMEAVEADAPALLRALEQSTRGIAIDMGAVAFISSSGLRMLLATDNRARELKKGVALFRLQPSVYKIFKVSALDAKFLFFDDEPFAVETLARS